MRINRLYTLTSIITLLLLVSACNSFNNFQARIDIKKYNNAIEDAIIAEENEICTSLIAINDSNTYIHWSDTSENKQVLVVTWTKYSDSYPLDSTISNSWGEIWVTIVPEMEDWFIANYQSGKNYIKRTEELLGLPRDKGYTHFVEMWVDPADLWRPSPDNEITDSSAELDIPANIDSSYLAWYEANITYSYTPARYPWTRLGYTYDWGNSESDIGLSEFVIKKNSQITVHKIYDSESYFKMIKSK